MTPDRQWWLKPKRLDWSRTRFRSAQTGRRLPRHRMTAAARSKGFDRTTLAFVAVLIAATAMRIWALKVAPLNLYHDEAEFWAWSRTPAWGYLSAPPMVAWA